MHVDDKQNTLVMEDPFSASPARHPYYISASLTQRLDLLQHLVEYSHQPILVLGEPGAGKTRMLDELMQRAEENWRAAVVDAGHTRTETEVLSVLAAAYGVLIEGADGREQFAALEAQLQAYTRAMLIPVLLLDNAQLLTDAALTRLLDLMQAGEADDSGLRVVMFCEPAAGVHINSLVLARHAQGITHSIDIPALNDEQIDEYLALYLTQVEGGEEIHFNDDEFELICRGSAGLPGQINRVAAQLLGAGPPEDDAESKPAKAPGRWLRELGRGRYLLLGAILLSIAVSALWQWLAPGEYSAVSDQDQIALNLPEAARQVDETAVKIPAAAMPAETTDRAVEHPLAGSKAVADVPGPAVGSEAVQETATESAPGAVAETPSETGSGSVREPPVAGGAASRSVAVQPGPSVPERAAGVDVTPAPVESPASKPAATQVQTVTTAEPPVQAGSRPQATAPVKPKPESGFPSTTKSKSTRSSTGGGIKGEAWLASLPHGAYVIQLFGSYDRAGALAFIHKHRKPGGFALLRTRHNRRDWYVVVHGQYAGKRQALRAVRHLPASLRRLKPWAREAAPLLEAVRLAN